MIVIRKYFSDNSELNAALLAAGGLGTAAAGTGAAVLGSGRAGKNLLSGIDSNNIPAEEKKALMDKLRKMSDVKITDAKGLNNAGYMPDNKMARKLLAKAIKDKRKKHPGFRVESKLKGIPLKNMGREGILIDPNFESPEVLAHEMGHSQHYKGRLKGIKHVPGKVAHKLRTASAILGNPVTGSVISGVNGVAAGMKIEKKKSQGKKASVWDRTRSVVVPAALAAPVLISEAAASKRGLALLKQAGASKQVLDQSRKNLGNAYKTYAYRHSIPVATGVGGELIGRAAGKIKYKNKDK